MANFAGTTSIGVTVEEEGIEGLSDTITFDLTVTTQNDPQFWRIWVTMAPRGSAYRLGSIF